MEKKRQVEGRKKQIKMQRLTDSLVNQRPSKTDPDGSYTGKPMDPDAIPVQDADDL